MFFHVVHGHFQGLLIRAIDYGVPVGIFAEMVVKSQPYFI
jgi:hypothetical protein